MEAANNRQIAAILKQYKTEGGEINFPAVMSIPVEERLPALYKKDFLQATALVVGALTMAFEKMALKGKIDGVLINNLAEEIIDTSDEDNIALEDLVLFLQYMVRGKYGVFDSISVPKFMSLFSKYRDERHQALIEYRENEHLQFKSMGHAERSYKNDPLSEHFANFGNSLNSLKQNMKELKSENNKLKNIDNF